MQVSGEKKRDQRELGAGIPVCEASFKEAKSSKQERMEARWKCQPSHVLIKAEVLQSGEQNSASTEVSANDLRMWRDVRLIEITLQSLTKTQKCTLLPLPRDFKRSGSEISAPPWHIRNIDRMGF